jgi:RIO kinase 1
MNTNDYTEFFDELDDDDRLNQRFGIDKRKPYQKMTRKLISEERQFVGEQDDSRTNFKFTYKAARFEGWWLLESLGEFYEHKWITDVLRRLKGGKEASVYLCRSGPAIDAPLVAAKVYRPRSLRNLKNDGQYRTGRVDLDENGHAIVKDGDLHAMAKRTNYGEELRHQSWISYEFQTLEMLHAAGADFPRPYAMEKNAILMDYIGDIDSAAPTLNTVTLDRDEVKPLYERVIRDVELLLTHQRIHGDLSAYNILYWEGEITLIDFPQAIDPRQNRNAYPIFERDVVRVCEYFARQGVKSDPKKLASVIWSKHMHHKIPDVHPRLLDADDEQDRRYWREWSASDR